MKNEELIKNYTANIETMTKDDYLQREYYDRSSEYKKNTLNNITLQRNYLKKYKKDFIAYFLKDYMNRYKRKTDAFVLPASCAFTGSIITFIYIFSAENLDPSVLSIFIGITILPTIIECVILPFYKSHKRYNTYLNNIDTKLEIIKNYQKETELDEKLEEDKSLNGVDSFIKLIISYKDDLDTLSEEDSKRIKIELVKLGKEYMEYALKGPKNGLEIDDTMINLNKRLADIELEIERLKQSTTKNTANEVALEEAFGLDITTLDTSSVEFNPNLDGPKLGRKLNK